MTFTYSIADSNPGTRETITAETRADALRTVYETLVAWNHDTQPCTKAIGEGVIYGPESSHPIFLEFDPVAFWSRAAELMLSDNQDFFEGTVAPWEDAT